MSISRCALVLFGLGGLLFACGTHVGQEGESCDPDGLGPAVVCARGLECDDHADFTCRPTNESEGYGPSAPTYDAAVLTEGDGAAQPSLDQDASVAANGDAAAD